VEHNELGGTGARRQSGKVMHLTAGSSVAGHSVGYIGLKMILLAFGYPVCYRRGKSCAVHVCIPAQGTERVPEGCGEGLLRCMM
jgi:hypothetical protein